MFALAFLIVGVFCCQLRNVKEAQCRPSGEIEGEISFCQSYLGGHVCVPYFHEHFPEWTLSRKDFLVQENVALFTE
jgi:hypothetical protein